MYKEYPVLPRRRVTRDPRVLLIDPAKKAAAANVEYRAEFELAVLVESSWPPAPRPFTALNNPGHMKQTKPSMTICVRG